MTAEQLKASVLQMAIEGRLVPQLEEEPAVSLDVEESDDVPFAIPEKWKWVRLGDIFTLQAGKFINASEITKEGKYPCYGGNGIRGYVNRINRRGCFPIIGRQGALCGNINMADGEFYATEHAVVVDCHCYGDPSCVGFFLQSMNLNQYATATAQPGLSVKKINMLFFPLPPLEEQRRIVARLDEILPLIESYGKAHDALEAVEKALPDKLRASLLQEAISGRLVPQLDEEPAVSLDVEEPDDVPFAIPEKWKWVRLGTCVEIVSARRVLQSDWRSSGIPFYRAREIGALSDNGFVNNELFIDISLYEKLKKFGIPSEGDLMVTAVGTLGKCYIVKKNDKFYYKDASVLCFKYLGKTFPEYLKYIMNSYFMKKQIGEFSSGTTVGTITIKNANKFLIPLPPLEEQRRIVARLNELLPCVDAMAKLHDGEKR